jgi:hypothetical protein
MYIKNIGTYVEYYEIGFLNNNYLVKFLARMPVLPSLSTLLISTVLSVVLFFLPLSSMTEIMTIATSNEEEGDEIDYDENDDDTDDFEQGNSIQICCTWGNALADGRLTYFIR